MHEVLVNRLGGLSLPRKSVVRLTDHPDMTLDVYHGRKTTMQHGPKGVRATEVRLYCDLSFEASSRYVFNEGSQYITKLSTKIDLFSNLIFLFLHKQFSNPKKALGH